MLIAYCDASGVIKFSRKAVPEGRLEIIRGADGYVRNLMIATARHAYDNKTLLVPGVPEAPNQGVGLNALIAFKKWTTTRGKK